MNRLCPAETRLKEGANAHNPDETGGSVSLAAGRWRPVSALAEVSRDFDFDVKRATSRNSAPEEHDVYSLIRSFQLRSSGARCVLLATFYIPLLTERGQFRPPGYKHVAPPEQESSDTNNDFRKLFQLPNSLLQELPLWFLLGQCQSFLIRGPGLSGPAQPAVHIRAG
jgi:hypothetical protein